MYSTCLFCNASLGANAALESFPVGRRVAFDPERGRLWAVCRSCERWNLSPIEERWEILEDCERLFRDTRKRASTENIGLAKLPDGLDLVRIGSPQRPEFAAWRYGDQFGRRRRAAVTKAALGVGAISVVYIGLTVAGISMAGFAIIGMKGVKRFVEGNPDEDVGVLPVADGTYSIKRRDLAQFRIIPDAGGWALEIPPAMGERNALLARRELGGLEIRNTAEIPTHLTGAEAEYAVRTLLPVVNRYGGNRQRVSEAVNLLERSDPSRYIVDVARGARPDESGLTQLPYSVRLALEMATHEEAERRALEGELLQLEEAWRVAEEIAAISDNLLVPQSIMSRIRSAARG